MKLSWLSFTLLASSVSVHAQYFSEGWKPGQPVTAERPAPSVPATGKSELHQPPQNKKASLSFDLGSVLNSGPVSSLFAKAGVNISEHLATVGLKNEEALWDLRIPFITDQNYNETIVNEELTPEEEQNRTWILIVSASQTNQGGGLSQFVDKIFDETFNETLISGELPNLRWGRIDYLNVTYLTTKWAVWQAPTFIILKDRGQTLRFIRPQYLRLRDGGFREFLETELYLSLPPWSSSFAPGGSNEYLMHYLGVALTNIYNITVVIPRWLLYIISGSIASFMIQLLHRPAKKPAPSESTANSKKAETSASADNTTTAAAAPTMEPATAKASGSTPKKGGAKNRKSKK